jgi:hypothetical protein
MARARSLRRYGNLARLQRPCTLRMRGQRAHGPTLTSRLATARRSHTRSFNGSTIGQGLAHRYNRISAPT